MKRFCLFLAFFALLLSACKKTEVTPEPPEPPVVNPPTATLSGLAYTTQLFPSESATVDLYFNASKGNTGLQHFTGDVYVHLGAITDKSTGAGDWKYVKSSNFNAPDPNVLMQRVSTNLYKISFTPKTFLSVPSGEKILKLAMVFRNADGSKKGVNTDNSDVYLDLYDPAQLNVRFTEPEFEPMYIPKPVIAATAIGQTIALKAAASSNTAIEILLNGTSVKKETTTVLSTTATLNTGGLQTLKVVAGGAKENSFSFLIAGAVVTAALPAGTKTGINYTNGGNSVVLALTAPGKQYVHVLGDFNNWTADAPSQLKKTPDGNTWWIQLDNITPGQLYRYQFLMDGQLRIADPYTEMVLDPQNDQYLTNKADFPYPADKTTGIVSTFRSGVAAYNWQHSFSRPDKNKLVVYELLLRDFTDKNNISGLMEKLDYLKDLGINAIELMPINEFEGNDSWGYNPSFYFALDKYYGSKLQLQQLVDACHSKGMAVIVDVVFNHAEGQSPMVQMYWDKGNNRPSAINPWFNTEAPHTALKWGNDFNHESSFTRAFIKDVLKYWLEEYKIDGYRFDFTKGFTQKATTTIDAMGVKDASRIAILKDYNNYIKTVSPNAYVILEHLCYDDEEKELAQEGMLLWNNLNHQFNEMSMGYSFDLSRSDYRSHGFTSADNLVTYMESHDEERMMYKNLQYGNTSGSYTIKNVATALKRQEAAATMLLLQQGPKMIWQFGELGYDKPINLCADGATINNDCRTGKKPILWQYNDELNRIALKDIFKQLIQLKLKNTVFQNGNSTTSFSGKTPYIYFENGATKVYVLGNFDVVPQSINLPLSSGTWYNTLNNNSSFTVSGSFNQTLQPGAYYVYSSTALAK